MSEYRSTIIDLSEHPREPLQPRQNYLARRIGAGAAGIAVLAGGAKAANEAIQWIDNETVIATHTVTVGDRPTMIDAVCDDFSSIAEELDLNPNGLSCVYLGQEAHRLAADENYHVHPDTAVEITISKGRLSGLSGSASPVDLPEIASNN